MCTVTYIPLKKGILFSSSRDENPKRLAAALPSIQRGENSNMLFPADGLAGGTWIGLNNNRGLIILLNGGFVNHAKQKYYRLSRGLIVKQLLDSKTILDHWRQLDLHAIEPFTLIVFTNNELQQLVWTGFQKIILQPDPLIPHIWSSATLYNPKIQSTRELWFQSFLLEYPFPAANQLLDFLLHASGDDNENGFTMNRNETIRTCSISIVEIKKQQAVFEYHDLLNRVTSTTHFNFTGSLKSDALNTTTINRHLKNKTSMAHDHSRS